MSQNHRVVIVGSSSFQDRACVFGLLDQLSNLWEAAGNKIERVYSGTFSGVAEFAKEWAQLNQVGYVAHNFFHDTNHSKNNPLFDMVDLPDFVLKEDSFFKDGRDFLMSEKVNMMITMPNAQGELGVETKNIMRMAQLMELPVLEGHLFYKEVLQVRDAEMKKSTITKTKLGSLDRI